MVSDVVTARRRRRYPTAIVLAGTLIGCMPGAAVVAAVTSVTVTPAAERVAPAHSTSIALSWSVATNTTGAVTVSSAFGQFRTPAGTTLGTIAQTLAKPATGPATLTFAETIAVPTGVIERVRREGYDHFVYRRSFTDGAAAGGEVKLYLATAKSTAFDVARMKLDLGDGAAARVVVRGETVRAHAALSYTGAGVLRANWEIAGPHPDPDKPIWRVLREVMQPVAADNALEIASPVLPTEAGGVYLVRLHVLEPRVGFGLPVVRYTVRQE